MVEDEFPAELNEIIWRPNDPNLPRGATPDTKTEWEKKNEDLYNSTLLAECQKCIVEPSACFTPPAPTLYRKKSPMASKMLGKLGKGMLNVINFHIAKYSGTTNQAPNSSTFMS
jgi:hypothetical protein